MPRVLITDYNFPNVDLERTLFLEAGFDVVTAQCKSAKDVVDAAASASPPIDAALIQVSTLTYPHHTHINTPHALHPLIILLLCSLRL